MSEAAKHDLIADAAHSIRALIENGATMETSADDITEVFDELADALSTRGLEDEHRKVLAISDDLAGGGYEADLETGELDADRIVNDIREI